MQEGQGAARRDREAAEAQRLKLGFARFRALPDWLGNVTSLRELDLQSSQVAKLPDTLAKLPLAKLNIRWSKVKPEHAKALLPHAKIEQ